MKIIDTSISEVKIIELDIFKDERGFFLERFNQKKFQEFDCFKNINFVQDNHSRSKPKVLKGLHYQENPSQGKFVSCIKGKIQDVAVDIRPNSATYLKYVSVILEGNDGKSVWIPQGFAHGFCVLGTEDADVIFKTDNLYNEQGKRGIIWNDPQIAINWQVKSPILSEKDLILSKILSS